MEVFCTRYALTNGIEVVEGEECGDSMFRCNKYTYLHGEGTDWHKTIDSAIARAEGMRQRKLSSLKKSVTAMEKLRFEG